MRFCRQDTFARDRVYGTPVYKICYDREPDWPRIGGRYPLNAKRVKQHRRLTNNAGYQTPLFSTVRNDIACTLQSELNGKDTMNHVKSDNSSLIFLFFLVICLTSPTSIYAQSEQQQAVDSAQTTFNNFLNDPSMTWFRENIGQAKAILIVPQLVRAGFIIGGSGGSGVLFARDPSTNEWAGPAFYTMGSGSVGFQAGVQRSEVVLLILSDQGVNSVLSSSFRLGADASIAAGPVGAGAGTRITSDIVTFSRSQGIFGGLAFDGTVINIRNEWNNLYYGEDVTPTDILVRRTVNNAGSDSLRQTLVEATKTQSTTNTGS